MNGDRDHPNLQYKEFVVELRWANHGEKWLIQATHRRVAYSASDEPLRLRENLDAEELGKRIGRVLFPLDVGTRLDEALKRAAARGREGLRVVIALPEPNVNPKGAPFDLDSVPWEAAQHGAHATFLFAMERVSIVRRWAPGEERNLFDPDHRNVVYIDASESLNADDDLLPDLPVLEEEQWNALGDFDGPQPTARNVKALADQNLAIFHFTGHGDADGLTLDSGHLGVRDLGDGLRNTRLAVLSACESAGATPRLHRSGLAGELARTVPAVIGMSRRVKDTDAATFSGELYRHLVNGYSLDESVRRGRLELLRLEPHTLAFTLPVFYLTVTGSTRPTSQPDAVLSSQPSTELLVQPLALVRGKGHDAVYGIESTRTGLQVVKLEYAGGVPALLAFDARVAAAQSAGEITIGDILADGAQPRVDLTRITLPSPFAEARLIAVSKVFRTSVLRLVIADGQTTNLLTRGFEWLPPKTLDAGFAAVAALDTTLGTLLLDGQDGQVIPVQVGSAGPFSLRRVSGFDSAYSNGVGVSVAWGVSGTRTVLEVQRWDERPGAVRSGDPQWIEVDLGAFDTEGIIRAGVVRELSSGAVPHAIAVQRGDAIELVPLPDSRPDAAPTR